MNDTQSNGTQSNDTQNNASRNDPAPNRSPQRSPASNDPGQHPDPHPTVVPRPRSQANRPDVTLAIGLGALTLLYPILNIAINLLGLEGNARIPVNAWLWLVIGVLWILAGWLTRTPQPVLTLLFAGIAGGVFTAVLVVIIQLIGPGGPGLATAPIAIVSLLTMNAVAGVLCGLIAWGLQTATRKPTPAR